MNGERDWAGVPTRGSTADGRQLVLWYAQLLEEQVDTTGVQGRKGVCRAERVALPHTEGAEPAVALTRRFGPHQGGGLKEGLKMWAPHGVRGAQCPALGQQCLGRSLRGHRAWAGILVQPHTLAPPDTSRCQSPGFYGPGHPVAAVPGLAAGAVQATPP